MKWSKDGSHTKKSDSALFSVLHLKNEHSAPPLHFTMVSWSLMLGKTHSGVPQAHTRMHTVLWAIFFCHNWRSPPCKTSSSLILSQERGEGVCECKKGRYTHTSLWTETHTDTTTTHTRSPPPPPHPSWFHVILLHSHSPFPITSHAQQASWPQHHITHESGGGAFCSRALKKTLFSTSPCRRERLLACSLTKEEARQV